MIAFWTAFGPWFGVPGAARHSGPQREQSELSGDVKPFYLTVVATSFTMAGLCFSQTHPSNLEPEA
jgi:hypothetical protein